MRKSRVIPTSNTDGVYTGYNDVNKNRIYYGISILKLPNGDKAKLLFDYGQLAAYFADLDGFCIVNLQGVNNYKSVDLELCEVLNPYL